MPAANVPEKHQTGQHTHMQPGYRKKMRQSGISVIFGNFLSYAAPVAGNDGRGNSGLIGRQNRIDFGHDPAAQIRRGFSSTAVNGGSFEHSTGSARDAA